MARREYVIHGRPPADESPTTSPRKTLSVRKDGRRASNLRTMYRDSGDGIAMLENNEPTQPIQDRRISSPTTPKLPPTPPVAAEDEEEEKKSSKLADVVESSPHETATRLRSMPVTPVNGNSPPTPDDTPPREQLRLPKRPFLNMRPSIASTRAESFRTAREQIYSDDESIHAESNHLPPQSAMPLLLPRHEMLSSTIIDGEPRELPHAITENDAGVANENLPSSPTLPMVDDRPEADNLDNVDHDTPETQFMFDDTAAAPKLPDCQNHSSIIKPQTEPSVHARVTVTADALPATEKSLRDRLEQKNQLQPSASTEAFANVIGWNDGVMSRPLSDDIATNRWSGYSNPSAVEAYVVESPVKPRKRGTLRKVVKNDSLRSVSSPIPKSNRTSLQSTSDSQHRLVHKKQKLGNQNRWSTGSDVSKISVSLGDSPPLPRQDVIKVAVIPERSSSLHTSASSSRRHSRSMSTNNGMPPVTPIGPRRRRAFSDSQQQAPLTNGPPLVPVRNSSLSAPTSRSRSSANSIASHQVSLQREQAEKDLRSTLDRMESERLSASLRRGSDQSAPSPTPAGRLPDHVEHLSNESHGRDEDFERASSRTEREVLLQRPRTIDLSNVTPGTKEWADLRSSDMTGTPFSQTSMLSTSPEIIEARIINFFPHNNESLQLIEPNRLSETPAVKALRTENSRRENTLPAERRVKITTPRAGDRVASTEAFVVDSPLRNPRRPPEPPQVQFSIIPPTPQSELNRSLDTPLETSPIQTRTGSILRRRPQLQGNERSESFIKTLGRGLSLRNAKNLKANQELDDTLHPFWRPRPFWDEDEQKRRSQWDNQAGQETTMSNTNTTIEPSKMRAVTILDPNQRLTRSHSIAAGPMGLVRRMSERRKQRRMVDDHLTQQQALVKQSSYSSLQRIRAGHRLFGIQPLRSLSLNANITRINSLRDRVAAIRARKEDEKREMRREKLRKSIGAEVVSQGDSRFLASEISSPMVIEHLGGRKVDDSTIINAMLENARAENVVEK